MTPPGDMETREDPANGSKAQSDPPCAGGDDCPAQPVSRRREILDNLPYAAMLLLGAGVFLIGIDGGPWRWGFAGLYVAYGLAGALWVMLFICPYCHFYATRLCPCGYGRVAPLLRARQDGDRFVAQFRKHIPVIVPLWVVPLAAGVVLLVREFSMALLVLLLAFAVNSFVVLPLVSVKYGCARCPQKGACPWMRRRTSG